ncbi:MAG: hypothetical protein AABY27_00130 [Pseudomonadota bacterium]
MSKDKFEVFYNYINSKTEDASPYPKSQQDFEDNFLKNQTKLDNLTSSLDYKAVELMEDFESPIYNKEEIANFEILVNVMEIASSSLYEPTKEILDKVKTSELDPVFGVYNHFSRMVKMISDNQKQEYLDGIGILKNKDQLNNASDKERQEYVEQLRIQMESMSNQLLNIPKDGLSEKAYNSAKRDIEFFNDFCSSVLSLDKYFKKNYPSLTINNEIFGKAENSIKHAIDSVKKSMNKGKYNPLQREARLREEDEGAYIPIIQRIQKQKASKRKAEHLSFATKKVKTDPSLSQTR